MFQIFLGRDIIILLADIALYVAVCLIYFFIDASVFWLFNINRDTVMTFLNIEILE